MSFVKDMLRLLPKRLTWKHYLLTLPFGVGTSFYTLQPLLSAPSRGG
jgi:hypothetical protein